MMRKKIKYSTIRHLAILGLVSFCMLIYQPIKAQEPINYDSLEQEYAELDSILLAEIENDSSSLFDLLEEILSEDYLKSQFAVRAGYTSDITNAGRNYGVQQFGLNSGIAYYHKSGFFADLAGYYNSDQDPKYNTTITTLGYMGLIGTKWNYYLSYDHFFYAQPQDTDYIIDYPLRNSFNSSFNFRYKGFLIGNDYSFLFGDENAHRIRLNLGYSYYTDKVWIFDKIGINPIISGLAGNANITTTVFNTEITRETLDNVRQDLGLSWMAFRILLRNNPTYIEDLLSQEQTTNSFGVMNYSLFLPISFNVKKTTLLLNYSINLPVALPGETNLDTSPNSYFSATLLYTFSFK